MGEYDMYTTYRGKLIDLCEENDLTCSLNCTNYPCTLTIRPVGGIDAQISMLEAVEHQGYTIPDASIAMCYIDGEIRVEVHGIFAIADAILSVTTHRTSPTRMPRMILKSNYTAGGGRRPASLGRM